MMAASENDAPKVAELLRAGANATVRVRPARAVLHATLLMIGYKVNCLQAACVESKGVRLSPSVTTFQIQSFSQCWRGVAQRNCVVTLYGRICSSIVSLFYLTVISFSNAVCIDFLCLLLNKRGKSK
jgi:hypothetical protein